MQRPTPHDIERAAARLSLLKFLPTAPDFRESLMELLEQMVPTVADLDWLVDAMVNRVGEWNGPAELRGVLTQRCTPLDGIEAFCVKGYYSFAAVEQRSYEAERDRIRRSEALPAPDLKLLLQAGKRKEITE